MTPSSHRIYLADLSDDTSTQLKLQTSTEANTLLSLQDPESHLPQRTPWQHKNHDTHSRPTQRTNQDSHQRSIRNVHSLGPPYKDSAVSHPPPAFQVSCMYAQPLSRAPIDQKPPLPLVSRHARNRRRYRRRLFPKSPRGESCLSLEHVWVVTGGRGVRSTTRLGYGFCERRKRKPTASLDSSLRFRLKLFVSAATQPKFQTRRTSHAMYPRIGQRCRGTRAKVVFTGQDFALFAFFPLTPVRRWLQSS